MRLRQFVGLLLLATCALGGGTYASLVWQEDTSVQIGVALATDSSRVYFYEPIVFRCTLTNTGSSSANVTPREVRSLASLYVKKKEESVDQWAEACPRMPLKGGLAREYMVTLKPGESLSGEIVLWVCPKLKPEGEKPTYEFDEGSYLIKASVPLDRVHIWYGAPETVDDPEQIARGRGRGSPESLPLPVQVCAPSDEPQAIVDIMAKYGPHPLLVMQTSEPEMTAKLAQAIEDLLERFATSAYAPYLLYELGEYHYGHQERTKDGALHAVRDRVKCYRLMIELADARRGPFCDDALLRMAQLARDGEVPEIIPESSRVPKVREYCTRILNEYPKSNCAPYAKEFLEKLKE